MCQSNNQIQMLISCEFQLPFPSCDPDCGSGPHGSRFLSELANSLESGCRAPPDAIALHCDGQRTPCMDGARRGGSLLCHAELCTLVRSLPPPTWRALRPTVNVQTQPYRFTLWHAALSTAPVRPILGPSRGAHAPVPRVGIYSRSHPVSTWIHGPRRCLPGLRGGSSEELA